MSWCDGPLCAFDLETTGVDVENDRIVTATVAFIPAAQDGVYRTPAVHTWLINPGVEIPEQATAVHGITTAHAREHGQSPAEALQDIANTLPQEGNATGVPIVGMNLQYDLTLLDRELDRHCFGLLWAVEAPVVDVFVIDKQVDTYRKGSRKLTALCEHYGVRLDGAHDATQDALGAARVAYRIARMYPEIGGMSLTDLHAAQVEWRAEQQASFRDYLAAKGEDVSGLRPEWPIIPRESSRQ